jgi:hypothetical protein
VLCCKSSQRGHPPAQEWSRIPGKISRCFPEASLKNVTVNVRHVHAQSLCAGSARRAWSAHPKTRISPSRVSEPGYMVKGGSAAGFPGRRGEPDWVTSRYPFHCSREIAHALLAAAASETARKYMHLK